jgi:hypothetical protein
VDGCAMRSPCLLAITPWPTKAETTTRMSERENDSYICFNGARGTVNILNAGVILV